MAYAFGGFQRVPALYDAENGLLYSIKVRAELGAKTGLATSGTVTGGDWAHAKRMRHAHFRGITGVDKLIKRSYPCSNAYWLAKQGTGDTQTFDGIPMTLTGFTGERVHSAIAP